MSSDNQYTALGPAIVGFQTDGTNIDRGADVAGTTFGAKGHSDKGTGVIGDSMHSVGVFGIGETQGVYGQGKNVRKDPASTTGTLGEGYEGASGVTGINFSGAHRDVLGLGAGVIGASNTESERDPANSAKPLGAGVVGLSITQLPVVIDSGPLPLPDPNQIPDGTGTGVWGASGSGTGVYGESQSGRGGVFTSANIAQLRLIPAVNPAPALPASGQWGDLYATVTGSIDDGTATATLYMCIASGDDTSGITATWAPFQFGPAQSGG